MILCDFGCGREAKYIFKTGAKSKCGSSHVNKCPVRRDKVSAEKTGSTSWCKGKTKDTDVRLSVISNKLKGRVANQKSIEKMKATKKSNPKPTWNKGLKAGNDHRILSGDKNGMWGKTHSDETRKLLSDIQKEREGFKGSNNPWYGKSRTGPASPRYKPELDHTDFQKFRNKTTMLTERTYKMHKAEINPDDLPRTIAGVDGGYHLDHKISVAFGYANGWTPEQLSMKENLQMLPWRDNIVKNFRCA
jgi:hypothetical protein